LPGARSTTTLYWHVTKGETPPRFTATIPQCRLSLNDATVAPEFDQIRPAIVSSCTVLELTDSSDHLKSRFRTIRCWSRSEIGKNKSRGIVWISLRGLSATSTEFRPDRSVCNRTGAK